MRYRDCIVIIGTLLGASGCEGYYGVPQASIVGIDHGVLHDPKEPLVVAFTRPVLSTSVKLEVAHSKLDQEGNLGDEDADPATMLDPIFAMDSANPAATKGGTFEWDADGTHLTIHPMTPFPLAQDLVLLLEPGVSSTDGHEYIRRVRIPFTYEVPLKCGMPNVFTSGLYFILIDTSEPVKVQVQLYAALKVDPVTGNVIGEYGNADRNPDPNRCGVSCASPKVCRLLPSPACADPSDKATTTDEFVDYVPNYTPPTGFEFRVKGCVDESTGPAIYVTQPFDLSVQSPPVSLSQASLTASFEPDKAGVLRGTGSVSARLFLGMTDSGMLSGVLRAQLVPAGKEPPGIHQPSD